MSGDFFFGVFLFLLLVWVGGWMVELKSYRNEY